uniref:DSN1 component of MIS12 kinetochore complex n=1 Tax=Corvus moneduloides TaxID=1196302 RepID=A0A8C3DMT7_CORMO
APEPAGGAAGRPRFQPRNGFSPQRCAGGPSPGTGGGAPDPHSAEKAADAEPFPKPPANKKGTPGSSSRKKRAPSSPRKEQPLSSFSLSPIVATPQGKRRSWRRSSLKGRRSRRKSLPPVHHEVTELSQSISLELPEIQRLSSLLLSSFQFSARKLQQILEESEGFDPEAFAAKVRVGSEEFQRLLQRLLQDGTLGSCLELPPGDPLDPALEGNVAQVKQLMASFSRELQAWELLLQRHRRRSQEASRDLELLRAGSLPQPPPAAPSPQILQILRSKPDYGQILAQQGPLLKSLRLLVEEVQQAAKLVMGFGEESSGFLRGLSEQLGERESRGFGGKNGEIGNGWILKFLVFSAFFQPPGRSGSCRNPPCGGCWRGSPKRRCRRRGNNKKDPKISRFSLKNLPGFVFEAVLPGLGGARF